MDQAEFHDAGSARQFAVGITGECQPARGRLQAIFPWPPLDDALRGGVDGELQALFDGLEFGDVDVTAEHATGLAVSVALGHHATGHHPGRGAVAAKQPELGLEWRAVAQGLHGRVQGGVAVARMNQGGEVRQRFAHAAGCAPVQRVPARREFQDILDRPPLEERLMT